MYWFPLGICSVTYLLTLRVEAAAGSGDAAPSARGGAGSEGEAASGGEEPAGPDAGDLPSVGRACGEARSEAEPAAGSAPDPPAPPTRVGGLPTQGVRLGPPGGETGSQGPGAVARAAPDPALGIHDGDIDVAGGNAGPSSGADPPLAEAAAASAGPDDPMPLARAADAPERLERAMRGRSGLGRGRAQEEAAPQDCTCRQYSHSSKGWCWEGKLPRGETFTGSNSCTRSYGGAGRRSEEAAKMQVALFLHSWWEANKPE